MKIAISTTSFCEYDDTPLEQLKKRNIGVALNPYGRKVTTDELVELASEAVGLIAGTESINKDVLKKLPFLKVISRCGTGMENVDLECAKRLGIKVFNTPDAPTLAVAELTIGLMLNILRKTGEMDRKIRAGTWKKMMGNLLSDKKVGIIGFGRIGKKVAKLLKPFGCEIHYSDPYLKDKDEEFKSMSKEELFRWADIITIHVSSKDRIVNKAEFEMLKKGSWIVNVSRGEVFDESALFECLRRGHISGAAIDVFEQEPYSGPLKDLDNVILTPHIGSYAKESRIKMEMDAVKNLIEGLK